MEGRGRAAWETQFVTCARDDAGQWRVNSINDRLISSEQPSDTPAAFLQRAGEVGWEPVGFQFVPSRSVLQGAPLQSPEFGVLAGRPAAVAWQEQHHGGNLVLIFKRLRPATPAEGDTQ